MIPIEDLTDVTLAFEDTYEDDEEDLTDVTLVSDDTYWRLDWCDFNNWGYKKKDTADLLMMMKMIKRMKTAYTQNSYGGYNYS